MDVHEIAKLRLGGLKSALACAVLCIAIANASPLSAAEDPSAVVNLLSIDTEVEPSGLYTRTTHCEIQATNDAGASQVAQRAVSYSDSLEELNVVEAYTRKADGRKLAVNANSIFIQQPQGTQSVPQFDDQRQKVIVFPNVAAGDTIVYTVQLRAKQARIPGQFTYSEIFPTTVAYKDVQESIIVPKTFPLQIESHDVTFEKQENGDKIVYKWRYSAPAPKLDEPLAQVSPIDRLPRVFVSTFKNYGELGRTYASIVAPKETLTPRIQMLADEITAGIANRRQQAEKIYNWVSKNIRYVAIDIDNGGIVPHEADSVLANGYGDCKDHTVLFAALLKARGIDSEVVLINSGNSYTMPDVPAWYPLDHAITWLPEFKLYADTTAGVAPFGTLPFAEYGKPVVHATASSNALDRTPVLGSGVATVDTKTNVRIDKDGKVTGDSTVAAAGPFSAILRTSGLLIQAAGPARLATAQLKNLGEVGTGSFEVPPPLELAPNYTVTTHFSFGPKADWMSGTQFEMVRGLTLADIPGDFLMGPLYDTKLSDAEPTVCFSGRQTEEITVVGPDDKIFDAPPSDISLKTANLQFTAHWSVRKNTATLRQEFTSSTQQSLCTGAARKDAAKALSQIRDYYNKSWVSFVVPDDSMNVGLKELNAGVDASSKGNYDEAIGLYSKAVGEPDITAENKRYAIYDRGLAYDRKGMHQEAITDFTAAIELDKSDFDALNARANAYLTLGERDKAIADFGSAIALKPNDAPPLMGRAWLYMDQQMFREATADFTAAIGLAPGDQVAYVGRARAYLARALFDHVIEDCTSAIKLGRKAVDCYQLRGFAYFVTSRLDDALSDDSQAIQIQANAAIYRNRGVTYLALGRNKEAIADFDKAIGLTANDASSLYARGVAKQTRPTDVAGDADIAAAIRINQSIGVQVAGLGVISGPYVKGRDDLSLCEISESNHDVAQAIVFCYRAFSAPSLSAADKAEARATLGVIFAFKQEYEEAIAQYDAALQLNPKSAPSLYGRGVAKVKNGNAPLGDADIAAARAIDANIDKKMVGRGVAL